MEWCMVGDNSRLKIGGTMKKKTIAILLILAALLLPGCEKDCCKGKGDCCNGKTVSVAEISDVPDCCGS